MHERRDALAWAGWRGAIYTTPVGRHRAPLGAGDPLARTTPPARHPPDHGADGLSGPTHNPWDRSARRAVERRVGRGGRGGAGARPAHASDGGGSIRIPGLRRGLVGLKVQPGPHTLGPPAATETASGVHVVTRSVARRRAPPTRTCGSGVGRDRSPPWTRQRPYQARGGRRPRRLRVGGRAAHGRPPSAARVRAASRRAGRLCAGLATTWRGGATPTAGRTSDLAPGSPCRWRHPPWRGWPAVVGPELGPRTSNRTTWALAERQP